MVSKDFQFFLESYGLSSDEITIYVSCTNSLLELNRFFESFKADPNQKVIALYQQLEAYTIDWPALELFAHTILEHRFGSQVADGFRDLARSFSSQGTFLDFSKSLSHVSEEAFLFAYGLVLLAPPLITNSEFAQRSDLMQTAGGLGGHPLSTSQIGRTQISSNKARLESLESLRTSEDLNTLSAVYVPADDLTVHVKGEPNSTDAADNNRAESSRQSASLSADRRSEALLPRQLDESKDDLVISLKTDGFSQDPSSVVPPVSQRVESIRQVVDSLEERLGVASSKLGSTAGLEVTDTKSAPLLTQPNELGAGEGNRSELITEYHKINNFSKAITDNEQRFEGFINYYTELNRLRSLFNEGGFRSINEAIQNMSAKYSKAKGYVADCIRIGRDLNKLYEIPAVHLNVTRVILREDLNFTQQVHELAKVKEFYQIDVKGYVESHKVVKDLTELEGLTNSLDKIGRDMAQLDRWGEHIEDLDFSNDDGILQEWVLLNKTLQNIDDNPVVQMLSNKNISSQSVIRDIAKIRSFNETHGQAIKDIETASNLLPKTYNALQDGEAKDLIEESNKLQVLASMAEEGNTAFISHCRNALYETLGALEGLGPLMEKIAKAGFGNPSGAPRIFNYFRDSYFYRRSVFIFISSFSGIGISRFR